MSEKRSDLKRHVKLTTYIDDKINMLENEFYLKLTPEEKAHFNDIRTEEAVDQYAHRLLRDKL